MQIYKDKNTTIIIMMGSWQLHHIILNRIIHIQCATTVEQVHVPRSRFTKQSGELLPFTQKRYFYISPCARYEVVLGITKPAS